MPLAEPDPDVAFREVEGETVLVHLRTNRMFALNRTGGRFWQLLAEGRERDDIERTLGEEFDVDPDQLSREIDGLLVELGRAGLLRGGT